MKDLIDYRAEFPILSTTTYLISNSLGAMPRGVEAALARYAESWATRGVRAWEEAWWELALKVGDKIAPILGADPGAVALHENGHSLGLGHFGPPPDAVMNPVYAGIRQSPLQPDSSGMCAIWSSWPN